MRLIRVKEYFRDNQYGPGIKGLEYVNMLDNTKLNITLVMVADYQLQSLDGTRRILLAGSLTAYYRQPLIIS